MNRIRIGGQTIHNYEQIIELSDKELEEFRHRLNVAKNDCDEAIDSFLGENYSDTEPMDWEHRDWSAELLDDNGSVIQHLDLLDYKG